MAFCEEAKPEVIMRSFAHLDIDEDTASGSASAATRSRAFSSQPARRSGLHKKPPPTMMTAVR
jgi:hypothetical protein